MDNSVLHPPNYQNLSDTVIGDVALRSRRVQRDFVDDGGSFPHENVEFVAMATAAPSEMSYMYNRRSTRVKKTHSRPGLKWGATTNATTQQEDGEEARKPGGRIATEIATEVDVVARFRERRRVTQMRYRKKMTAKALTLESEVQLLRDELRTLDIKLITLGVLSNPKPWCFAVEYFHLFRSGLKPTATQEPGTQDPLASVECTIHRKFLQSNMAPDVAVDTGYGVEEILKCWGLLSRYYDSFNIELERLDSDHRNSVVAYGSVRVAISENTLRHSFPQLGIDGKFDTLGTKLLGRELTMRGFLSFGWDHVEDRVASVQYSFDMPTPLMQLLGSLGDATHVFESALMTPDCRFVSN